MTNAQLDPAHPERGWKDRGLVFASKPGDHFNAIDASRLDTADGRAWLAFGSFWDGIKTARTRPHKRPAQGQQPRALQPRLARRRGD